MRQLEAAVAVAEGHQKANSPPDRRSANAGGAERFNNGGGVVRICSAGGPTPPAGFPLAGEQPANRGSVNGRAGCFGGDHAPGGRVDQPAERPALTLEPAQPAERAVGSLAKRGLRQRDEREIRRARQLGLVLDEVSGRGTVRLGSGGTQSENRPASQLGVGRAPALGEASVLQLVGLQEAGAGGRGRSRYDGDCKERDELHVQTISLRTRLP